MANSNLAEIIWTSARVMGVSLSQREVARIDRVAVKEAAVGAMRGVRSYNSALIDAIKREIESYKAITEAGLRKWA